MAQPWNDSDKQRVAAAVEKRHRQRLHPGETVEVTHDVDGGLETLGFLLHRGPEVFCFEAQLRQAGVKRSSELLADFLDAVVAQWLAGGREAYPTLDFTPFIFEGVTIGLRGGKRRPDLEAEADRLLREGG